MSNRFGSHASYSNLLGCAANFQIPNPYRGPGRYSNLLGCAANFQIPNPYRGPGRNSNLLGGAARCQIATRLRLRGAARCRYSIPNTAWRAPLEKMGATCIPFINQGI
jgi:hypothetical protein